MHRIRLVVTHRNNLAVTWSHTQLSTAMKSRLNLTLTFQLLLHASESETWTINQADFNRLQAQHMRSQQRIPNVRWFDKVKNTAISSRPGLLPIGDMLLNHRNSLFGHVVWKNPMSVANQVLMLCRDIYMN